MIDCTLPVIYNGHTSAPLVPPSGGGPVYGCVMKAADAYGVPVEVHSEKRAQSDGASLSDAYLGGLTIPLHAEVWGRSEGEVNDLVAAFMAAYSPRSPSLYVSSPFIFARKTNAINTWATSQIPLYMTAAPIRQPWRAQDTRRDASQLVVDVYAELFAADPYQYIYENAGARQIVQLGTSASAIPYRGNAPSLLNVDLWIRLSGTPGPVVTVTIDSAYSRPDLGYSSLVLDLSSLASATIYDLSFAQKRITSGAAGIVSAGSIFGALTPGCTARYAVNSGTAGNLDYIKILYPEAFF